jgi:hypothetical protein
MALSLAPVLRAVARNLIHGMSLCRDISDTNKRLFFEEAYEREQARHLRESSERKQMQQDLAKQMKRASAFVRPDMDWAEAREILLTNGFSILRKLAAPDAERVRLAVRQHCAFALAAAH